MIANEPVDPALEALAREIAAKKMHLTNKGTRLPDDLWRQALPKAVRFTERYATCEALLRNPSDELVRDTGLLVFDVKTVPSISGDVARAILHIAANAIAALKYDLEDGKGEGSGRGPSERF